MPSGVQPAVAGRNRRLLDPLPIRAAPYPASGGAFVHGRERLGDFWGCLAGWAFVVGKADSRAAMALTVGSYVWPGQATVHGIEPSLPRFRPDERDILVLDNYRCRHGHDGHTGGRTVRILTARGSDAN